jgi:hypothetical protein
MHELSEMARIAASYTARLSPEEVRLSRIGRFIWLRLHVRAELRPRTRSITTNLVFRLSTDAPRPVSFIRTFRDRAPAAPQE